ncbi:MAG: phosphate ABC transporter substrate-binding protein PstS [Thermoplasmata archaeon]|nr:phosphate ABC transporter substrate-binding protein PstS [Thermoplasmata archaeon]
MSGSGPASQAGSNAPPSTAGAEAEAYLRKAAGRKTTTWVLAVVAVVVVVALVGGAYAAGWIKPASSASGSGYEPPCASLSAAGSTFVNPLMQAWTYQYSTLACHATAGATQVQVNYQPVGSGTGITDLTGKLVNIGASDAPLTTAQQTALPAPVITMPESAGAVTVIYDLTVKDASGAVVPIKLSGPVLALIFNTNITNWNDSKIAALNPGITIPSQLITVVHRSDGSGTTFAFTTYLSAESAYWSSHISYGVKVNWPTSTIGQPGSTAVAGYVNGHVGAIGYDELNYAHYAGTTTFFASILNHAGNYILPDVTNTAAALAAVPVASFPVPTANWSGFSIINEAGASTYPIATLTYLMVYTDLGKVYGSGFSQAQAQALVSFLWWITHTGQASAAGQYYVPFSSGMVSSVCEAAIADIHYNGAALVSH